MFSNKEITPTLLSDHMPYLVETNHSVKLIGWNIMKQMKFKGKFYNNGFNCKEETEELYNARFNHEAAQLKLAIQQYQPAFICLQECPETLKQYEEFVGAFPLSYAANHFENNVCNLITLYDTSHYDLESALTTKMKAAKLNEGLNELISPLVFLNKKSNETMLVVNVHATFGKDVVNDVKALHEYAASLGINDIILLGDFNRDLVKQSDDYSRLDVSSKLNESHLLDNTLTVKAIDSSSFCSSFSSNGLNDQWVETRDGTISTRPVSVQCLIEIGKANTTLSFTKPISETLKISPTDFLSKLDTFNQENTPTQTNACNF